MPIKKFSVSGEYDDRLAKMISDAASTAASMAAHIEADRVAFAALISQLTEVNKDVKSLLAVKSFAAGIWKAVAMFVASGLGVGVAGLIWRLVTRQ
jgi:hypothetical protein